MAFWEVLAHFPKAAPCELPTEDGSGEPLLTEAWGSEFLIFSQKCVLGDVLKDSFAGEQKEGRKMLGKEGSKEGKEEQRERSVAKPLPIDEVEALAEKLKLLGRVVVERRGRRSWTGI